MESARKQPRKRLGSHLAGSREVGLDVELREEDEEEDGVGRDEVGELPREVAVVVEDQLDAVHEDADELHHLQRGHVLLPPDVLLILRAQSGHEVVEIHEEVNEDVEESEERGVASRDEPHSRPDREGHDAVVDHVQERNVREFLSGDEAELKVGIKMNYSGSKLES